MAESSCIESVEWEPSTHTMTVRIKDGRGGVRTYPYTTVPHALYLEFISAPSRGRFYNARIKGKYA